MNSKHITNSIWIFLCLALAIKLGTQIPELLRPPCERGGDFSLLALKVEQAKNFELLTGPYSRNQFDHPGPISFYLYALGERILGESFGSYASYALTQLAVNLLLIIAALYLFSKEAGFAPAPFLLVAFAFLLFPNSKSAVLTDIWGPSVLLSAMLSFVVAAVSLSLGNLRSILLLTISAVLLLSNHIGTALIIGVLSVASFIYFFKGRREAASLLLPGDLKWILAALIVIVLAAFPPIYEALSAEDWGNFGRIKDFMSHSRWRYNLWKAFSYLAQYFGPTPLIGLCLMTLALLISYISAANNYFARLRLFVLLSICCALISIARIRGGLQVYIFWHQIAVAVLLYTLVLSVLFTVAAKRSAALQSYAWILSVAAIFLAIFSMRSHGVEQCDSHGFYAKISEDLKLDRNHLYEITNYGDWGYQGGLVLELTRAKIPVCVRDQWRFMYGEKYMCKLEQRPKDLQFAKIELRRGSTKRKPRGFTQTYPGLTVSLISN